MEKIKMTTPLVEMDGDEMTRILWKMIKDELILPFVDLKTEYYDLGLPNRDATADQVTMDAALANKKYGVSVKCATITPNAQRVEEYKLHEMWKSPNGTIRAVLDGTVFRAPIMIDSIQPVVKNWKKPITIARHAYGDVYKCTEFRIPGAGKAELVFTGADGSQQRATVFDFEGAGVLQGQYNKDDSIRSFARSCFNYALDVKQEVIGRKRGTIVNVGSCSAEVSSISRGEYCISKSAIAMITKLFADRLAGEGILVHEVRPGVIMTDMTSTVKEKYDRLIAEGTFPIPRWGTPEDVAGAVSALCSDQFLYTTGNYIDIDGGFHIKRL